MKQKINVY